MIPFLSVKPSAIRLKVKPLFPSQVFAAPPLTLTKIDGNFTFGLDLAALTASLVPIFAGTYLPLAGGTMTGAVNLAANSTAPTPLSLDSSTKIATTAYVDRTTRDRLIANRTYFVRSDGNDSNSGLVNSAGSAFLTAQRAINVCATLDLAGFNITIQMVNNASTPQTYTGPTTVAVPFVGGVVTLQGDPVTPGNLILSSSTGNIINVLNRGTRLDVLGFRFQTTGGWNALNAADGGLLRIVGRVEFGAVAAACLIVDSGFIINFANAGGSPHIRSLGNIGSYITAINEGKVSSNNITHDIAAGLTCVNFAVAQVLALIEHAGNTYTTSTFTGAKGVAQSNSVVNLTGAGTGSLPASGAFTPTTGGIVI